ncbi:MAG: aldo/keto reductase [Blastocatellia bacterium]|nr:aldo/keto reductase [Blastocatellia bacterium]
MEYRTLGKTGLKVSEICLGAMTFGKNFYGIAVMNQDEATAMIARSTDAGVNFIDTADIYSYGESEEIVGNAIRELAIRRDYIVVATKVRGAMGEGAKTGGRDVNNVGLSRHHIISGCEASLKRLGLDYIDLYQVHGWDSLTPIDETLRALEDLVRQGKVRYLGCSNWSARQLMKAVVTARERGWDQFSSLQAYYSLVARDLEHELVMLCEEEGLGILPWSPLSGGFLSGKYTRETQKVEGTRRNSFDFPPIDPRSFDAIDTATEIAKERGATVAQVSIAWLLAQKSVSSVIIGANKLSQLEDNLKSAELKLTTEEVERLSATTQPPKLYPQWMIEFQRGESGR